MNKIQIFEGPLCCSSGVCGVNPDEQLIAFAADVEWLKQNGGVVERFNLAQQPLSFAQNTLVQKFLQESGQEGLPVTIVKGEIVLTGTYPERAELAAWAGVKGAFIKITPLGGGCCSGGKCK